MECVRLVDDSAVAVWASADTSRANTAFRGLVPAISAEGTGLVLCATSPNDGDCLQTRPEPVGRACPGAESRRRFPLPADPGRQATSGGPPTHSLAGRSQDCD